MPPHLNPYTIMQSVTRKLAANPKLIFLVDGAGALLTALFLGLILPSFEESFGMPRRVLYPLALVACFFAVYSLCCYFFIPRSHSIYLRAIMIANLLYCIASAILVIYFRERLTVLGLLYFSLEILVLAGLICLEMFIFKDNKQKND